MSRLTLLNRRHAWFLVPVIGLTAATGAARAQNVQPPRVRFGATFRENDRIGVRVERVYPGMPASRFVHEQIVKGRRVPVVTTLAPGDLIVYANGMPVHSVDDLRNQMADLPAGARFEVEGLDAAYGLKRPFRGYVILGAGGPAFQNYSGIMPAPMAPSAVAPAPAPGMNDAVAPEPAPAPRMAVNDTATSLRQLVGAAFEENGGVGVRVTAVYGDTPAMRFQPEGGKQELALALDDLIVYANGNPVRSVDDLRSLAEMAGPGGKLMIEGLDASYNWSRTFHGTLDLGKARPASASPTPPPPTPSAAPAPIPPASR